MVALFVSLVESLTAALHSLSSGEKKKGGEGVFRGGEGSEEVRAGVAERGAGERGSNLSSIQRQKPPLPTIGTMIQKFVLRSAACHCRGGG